MSDSSALHCVIASSGSRCSSYKPVVLVTLGGCHLQDGLVVVSVEARNKLVRCCGKELCEGHCARPMGAEKSNSSRARREGRQVVWPCQSARACGKHSTWESMTCGSPLARGPMATLELVLTGTSVLASM